MQKEFFLSNFGGMGHLKRHADKNTTSQNDHTQTQISFSNLSIGTFVFNNENVKKEIAKFIVQLERPFYLAENPAFINAS